MSDNAEPVTIQDGQIAESLPLFSCFRIILHTLPCAGVRGETGLSEDGPRSGLDGCRRMRARGVSGVGVGVVGGVAHGDGRARRCVSARHRAPAAQLRARVNWAWSPGTQVLPDRAGGR